MFDKKSGRKITYGIVGLGRFGQALARDLAESGAELIVLDSSEDKVREMRELTENAYVVKSLDKRRWKRRESRTATSRWSASASRWIPPF